MARSGKRRVEELATPPRGERYAAGKALRRRVTRKSHGTWSASADRLDPVDLLTKAAADLIPQLVPIRFGRMLASPFAFFRGSANLMAHDLSSTPVTGTYAQLCGDAHLSNFGIFGTPERDQVFDVNDFDETLPGPWEWDVKRLAVSIELVGRLNHVPAKLRRDATLQALASYRLSMNHLAGLPYLDIWYRHLDARTVSSLVKRFGRELIEREVRKASHRTGRQAFPKLVERVRGEYRIRDEPPLLMHYRSGADTEYHQSFFENYLPTLPEERRMLLEHYRVVDVAQKVVGVGSVGTHCSVVLLMGDPDVEDPLILQLKQATASALEPYLGASAYPNHAERVVVGQHLIQEASDIFLGWSHHRSLDFYVRQLRDMKFSTDVEALSPKGLAGKGELCGAALARAHARTGDPAKVAGYLGNRGVFDEAVADFARAYANQTEQDYSEFLRGAKKGRFEARITA